MDLDEAAKERRWLETEKSYRLTVRQHYYLVEEDFATLDEYNDYLEDVEDIIEKLTDEATRAEGRALLDRRKALHAAASARNRAKLQLFRKQMSEAVDQERIQAEQRSLDWMNEERDEKEVRLQQKAALQDQVAAGKSLEDAQKELKSRETAAAQQAAAAPASAPEAYQYVPQNAQQVCSSHPRDSNASTLRHESSCTHWLPLTRTLQAHQPNEARAQPLKAQAAEKATFLQPSAQLATEAYEKDEQTLDEACRAGGYDRNLWQERYQAESFNMSALVWELR